MPYLYSVQSAMFGTPQIVGYGDDDFAVREIHRDTANTIIRSRHYSGTVVNNSYIHLGVFAGGELLGVLQYGYAMNPASGGGLVEGTANDGWCELNRMWLSDDLPRNSESRAISASIRYIRKRYPKIAFIQSFADGRLGGCGIVYQAANFLYYGSHNSVFWVLPDGTYVHNINMTDTVNNYARIAQTQKHLAKQVTHTQYRYIYWLDKRLQAKCKLPQLPYPKPNA